LVVFITQSIEKSCQVKSTDLTGFQSIDLS